MKWFKASWFPATALLLVAIISCNLYTIFFAEAPAPTAPGPRTIMVAVAPKASVSPLNPEALREALESYSPVHKAEVEITSGPGPTRLLLTVVEPLSLSQLKERLAWQDAMLLEDRSLLHGALRLRVSGRPQQDAANSLKEALGGLNGVEVLAVDLTSPQEPTVTLRAASDGPASIASLRQALEGSPFRLRDIEWPAGLVPSGKVVLPEGSASRLEEGSSTPSQRTPEQESKVQRATSDKAKSP